MKKTWIMAFGILIMGSHSAWGEQSISEADYLDYISE